MFSTVQNTDAIYNSENPEGMAVASKTTANGRRRAPLGDISNQTQNVVRPNEKIVKPAQRHPRDDGDGMPMQIDDDDINELLADEDEAIDENVNDEQSIPSQTLCVSNLMSGIDVDDMEDPQLVAEYIEDIFRHYFEVEVYNHHHHLRHSIIVIFNVRIACRVVTSRPHNTWTHRTISVPTCDVFSLTGLSRFTASSLI